MRTACSLMVLDEDLPRPWPWFWRDPDGSGKGWVLYLCHRLVLVRWGRR